MMKILVTGSSGFIGSKLIPALKHNGHDVLGIDIQDGSDIANWDNIKHFRDIDIIIHLASKSFVPDSYKNPREMYHVNITGTMNMLELSRINNARFIFTSSYVYGNPKYLPIDEKHPTDAFNPYCNSKLIGEALCLGYNKDFNTPVTIFRPFNIYGPGQNPNFIIPLIYKQIRENKEITLRDPRPKRDFIHLDDVVNAFCLAVEYEHKGVSIMNLGSGFSYSVEEIVNKIIKKTGKKIPVTYSGIHRKNEVLDTIADISLIKKELNWIPKINIDRGLE